MTNTERILSVLASIVSIGQFVIAVPSLVGHLNPHIVKDVATLAMPARVAILIILEVSCAHVFGLVFTLAVHAEHDAVWLLGIISISVANAWISLFNIQYFLFGSPPTQWQHLLGLLPIAVLAAVIACIFANIHLEAGSTVGSSNFDPEEDVPTFQAIAYAILYIALWFQ